MTTACHWTHHPIITQLSLMIKEGKMSYDFWTKWEISTMLAREGVKEVQYSTKRKSHIQFAKKNLRMHREHPNKYSTYNLCKCYVCIKVDIFQEGHISDIIFKYSSVKNKLWQSYHDVCAIRWSYGKIWMSAAMAL